MHINSKKKIGVILAITFCIIAIVFVCFAPLKNVNAVNQSYIVVIDAGHGGRDGGCVGVNGSIESELNLQCAKKLQHLLSQRKVKVIMTRKNDNGLYDISAKNKKLDDMKARAEIIENAEPDLVVSIHMNSFPIKSASGAKVFYKIDSEPSKNIASKIQRSINMYCNDRNYTSAKGDYYILNCTRYSSVLVECGYLSNVSDEEKLNNENYQQKLMHSIFVGILISLGLNIY